MWETPSVERGKPLERATQTMVGRSSKGNERVEEAEFTLQIDDDRHQFFLKNW